MTWENRVEQMARMGDLDSQYEKEDRKPPCFHHDTNMHSCRCHFPTSGMSWWLYHVYRLYIYFILDLIYYLLYYIYIYIHTLYLYILYISSDHPFYIYISPLPIWTCGAGKKSPAAISSLEIVQYCTWGYRNQLNRYVFSLWGLQLIECHHQTWEDQRVDLSKMSPNVHYMLDYPVCYSKMILLL